MRALVAALLVLAGATAASAQDGGTAMDASRAASDAAANPYETADATVDARRRLPRPDGALRRRDAAADAIADAAVRDADADAAFDADAEIEDAALDADDATVDVWIFDATGAIPLVELDAGDGGLDADAAGSNDADASEDAALVATADASVLIVPMPMIAPPTPQAPQPTVEPTPVIAPAAPVIVAPAEVDRGPGLRDLLPSWDLLDLSIGAQIALLLIAIAISFLIGRARNSLAHEGALPLAASFLHALVRIAALAVGITLLVRLLPPGLWPALPLTLAAAAIALGLSLRDLLPDLLAGIVIAFEQRVQPGTWVAGNGFGGIVERRSLRATWLRDGHGRRIAVPNRVLLRGPIASHISTGPVHDTTLRIASEGPAGEIRRAILDAVLASPWVRAEVPPAVRRDGKDPMVWHVRAPLLDMRFGSQFEGDLLERTEEMLQGESRWPTPRTAPRRSLPPAAPAAALTPRDLLGESNELDAIEMAAEPTRVARVTSIPPESLRPEDDEDA